MYCEHFGLKEKPFTITPNPNFIFLSENHREAFAHLLYGVENHAGFIALVGEVGTGKTTLLRTLLSDLDRDKYRSALVFNPCMTVEQMLATICREYEISSEESSKFGYHQALNSFLLEENRAGRTVILVVDEAQNLSPPLLEQIRMISNLETESDKLIQIIVAGQPELNKLLARNDLRQLNQRITVRCYLKAMNIDDTADYIRHRLKIAGSRIPKVFSDDAVKVIYRYSKGVPRVINAVCDQTLVKTWTEEELQVNAKIAKDVISSMQIKLPFFERVKSFFARNTQRAIETDEEFIQNIVEKPTIIEKSAADKKIKRKAKR